MIGSELQYPANFDAIEVHGVRDCYTAQQITVCEVDDDNPQFFSVYGHLREGGVDCLEDFEKLADALEYGLALAVNNIPGPCTSS